MRRAVPYQAATVREDQLLLIRHPHHETGRSYWMLPGGGREAGERDEHCVRREALEETHLQVEVGEVVLEVADLPESVYERLRTHLCHPIGGTAAPGVEPEMEAAASYAIAEARWFDLRDMSGWDPLLLEAQVTYPQVQELRVLPGYAPAGSSDGEDA